MQDHERTVDWQRRLLNVVLGGGLLGLLGNIFYPILRFVIPPARSEANITNVVAGKVDELGPNEGKIFRFGNRPGLLVRLPNGEFRAFNAVCAHLQCTVQYRDDLSQVWCACHNGLFNLNGEVLSGPPPASLEAYQVDIRGDDVVVSKG